MKSWRALLVTATVLGGALAPPSTVGPAAAAPVAAVAGSPSEPSGCGSVEQPFAPTRLTIPGVVGSTRVLALGRDRNGVPRTPPLTGAGKWQFAYDKQSGVRPGGRFGVVRLTAHTYPWSGGYGEALGNRLLRRLHVGDRITVVGPSGQRLCYRVDRRQQVRAQSRLSGYYSSTGPSRLAILVCSGVRRGPGDWSHRTIWYATPPGGSDR